MWRHVLWNFSATILLPRSLCQKQAKLNFRVKFIRNLSMFKEREREICRHLFTFKLKREIRQFTSSAKNWINVTKLCCKCRQSCCYDVLVAVALVKSYTPFWQNKRGIEWSLEKRGSQEILARSRNLGSAVFDGSRSLVFGWFLRVGVSIFFFFSLMGLWSLEYHVFSFRLVFRSRILQSS